MRILGNVSQPSECAVPKNSGHGTLFFPIVYDFWEMAKYEI
jgi:hypothetical protein